MKKTIKLRDLTKEQFVAWRGEKCSCTNCDNCPFRCVNCNSCDAILWVNNKDVFNDKFLDQTIEIEVPDLLTEEEKELLKDFDYFSLNSLTAIKIRLIGDSKLLTLYHGSDDFYVEFYVKNYLFKGLTEDNIYRVSDLGLEDK
jgi:hypothetical protein